jgi:hypothetical protein
MIPIPWTAALNAFPSDDFEKRTDQVDFVSPPFRRRDYGLFGFLAGVRNYACCEPLAPPRGLPEDCDQSGGCAPNDIEDLSGFHSHSWLLLSELLSFDYDKVFWNRRIHRGKDGRALAGEDEGVHQSYRELLGSSYMHALEKMQTLGELDRVRVVFCFGD